MTRSGRNTGILPTTHSKEKSKVSFREWLAKQRITCDDYDMMEEQERQCLANDFDLDTKD